MEVWMGTHPTKRLFFRRLAVEKGKNYGADEIATSVPRRSRCVFNFLAPH